MLLRTEFHESTNNAQNSSHQWQAQAHVWSQTNRCVPKMTCWVEVTPRIHVPPLPLAHAPGLLSCGSSIWNALLPDLRLLPPHKLPAFHKSLKSVSLAVTGLGALLSRYREGAPYKFSKWMNMRSIDSRLDYISGSPSVFLKTYKICIRN